METFVIVVHVIVSILLILFVLAQAGKGAEAGAMFGGVSNTFFGSEGGNILTKITTTLAIIFMLTSISLTVMQSKQGSQSVLKEVVSSTTAQISKTNKKTNKNTQATQNIKNKQTQVKQQSKTTKKK